MNINYKIKLSQDTLTRKNQMKIILTLLVVVIFTLVWLFVHVENDFTFSFKYHSFGVLKQKPRLDTSSLMRQNEIIFVGEKIVHIDLKGAPPKVSYFKHFFRMLAKLGATGILMEYEDTFPFKGNLLGNVSALNAYTIQDIKLINDIAAKFNLKIIPLVQTFGHMEFILKLEEFTNLREERKYPLVICPSRHQSLVLLMDMIEQVIQAHPRSEMIHIGADEVYLLGQCDKCLNRMNKNNWSKQRLFLAHVSTMARKIKEDHPNLRILMWDDEFRKANQDDLEYWKISELVEPVVWKYTRDVHLQLGSDLWDMYVNVFSKIWIASAYKGATGSNKITTDIHYHLENHKSWMQIYEKYSSRLKFEGIILTGWQRYDHFAVLCELLPVGIPSLAMCLHLIRGLINTTLVPPQTIVELLQCENIFALLEPPLGTPKCTYLGGDILENALKLHQLKQDISNLLKDSKVQGWMSTYNVEHAYSNIYLVESAMENLNVYKMELMQIESDIVAAMNRIYDNHTITEWCDTYVKPVNRQIEQLWQFKEKLLAKDTWPRRPLTGREL